MADNEQAVEPTDLTDEQREYYAQAVIPFGNLKNVKAVNCTADDLAANGYKSTDFEAYPMCKIALGGELAKIDEVVAANAGDDEDPSTDGDSEAPASKPKRTAKKK